MVLHDLLRERRPVPLTEDPRATQMSVLAQRCRQPERQRHIAQPSTLGGGKPLDRVLDRLPSRHVGSAPVTRHGRLAGIFTLTDAARLFCEHLRALFPVHSPTDVA